MGEKVRSIVEPVLVAVDHLGREAVSGSGRPSGAAIWLVCCWVQKKLSLVLSLMFWSSFRLGICCVVLVTMLGSQFSVVCAVDRGRESAPGS